MNDEVEKTNKDLSMGGCLNDEVEKTNKDLSMGGCLNDEVEKTNKDLSMGGCLNDEVEKTNKDLSMGGCLNDEVEKTNKDLSMGGCLNDEVEKRSCCKTIIIGPLLDGYIGQFGMEFKNKIGRGKNTGLQQSSTLFFPYQIFIQFSKLAKGYGGDFTSSRDNKGVLKDLVVTITSQETSKMVWHPRRLCGSNYLVKRKFKKLCLEGKK